MGNQFRHYKLEEVLDKELRNHLPSVTLEQILNTNYNRKKQFNKRLIPVIISCVIVFASMISPSARAVIEGWLQFSKVEEGKTHIGWSWDNTAGNEQKNYQSLKELEREFNTLIPFPQVFSNLEVNEAHKQYQYSANIKNNKLIAFHYRLNIKGRSYNLMAARAAKRPEFSASTAKNSVIDKEIKINGISGRMLAIHDMNIFHIYLEKDHWKLVLTASSGGLDAKSGTKVTESEIIKLAESITW